MKLLFERRDVSALKPYSRNTKNHGDGDIDAIAASITRFGFNDPIGITPDGVIVEGHGRYEAAKKLGMPDVPVVVLEGGDDRQYDLYRIAHNKIALSTGFDFEVLVQTLQEVVEDGGIKVADMGFSVQAYDNLVEMFAPEETRPSNRSQDNAARQNAHEYDIIFDNKEQKTVFSNFMKKLKEQNPGMEEGTAFLRWAQEHVALSESQQEQTNEQS